MADYYPPKLTAQSRILYQQLRAWAEPRGDIGLIGGWAVVELVDPQVALPSRDVDLVFRTPQALEEFHAKAPEWGLRPSVDPVDRHAIYEYVDDPSQTTAVDVFATEAWEIGHVPKDVHVIIKRLASPGFVPPLQWLLRDKLETVRTRGGKDAYEKQEKDLLDVHRLVFHNRNAVAPLDLLRAAPRSLRREAAGERIRRAIQNHPAFADDYRKVDQWLNHP